MLFNIVHLGNSCKKILWSRISCRIMSSCCAATDVVEAQARRLRELNNIIYLIRQQHYKRMVSPSPRSRGLPAHCSCSRIGQCADTGLSTIYILIPILKYHLHDSTTAHFLLGHRNDFTSWPIWAAPSSSSRTALTALAGTSVSLFWSISPIPPLTALRYS